MDMIVSLGWLLHKTVWTKKKKGKATQSKIQALMSMCYDVASDSPEFAKSSY